MRHFLSAMSLFFIFLVAPALVVADDGGIDLSFYANYWDVDDGDDNVWGPGLGLAIPLYNNQVKGDVRISWFEDVGSDRFGDLALYPLDFGLSWHHCVDCTWNFSAMTGLSVVFADEDEKEGLEVDIDDELGGYVGGGVNYKFDGPLKLFTNVYYRFVTLDADVNTRGVDESTEFDADGLNLDIGLAYTF